MRHFEDQIKRFLTRTQSLTTVEFFNEQHEIKDEINKMKREVNFLNNYMPKVKLRVEDYGETIKKIQEDLKLKLDKYLEKVDSTFALENYDYLTKELENPKLKSVYELMGPFDFHQFKEEEDENQEDESSTRQTAEGETPQKRDLQVHFEPRRSGALYRGEVNLEKNRPDGKGFKIFNKRSTYEGYFKNGVCHGFGRGVTSSGEVYQGIFVDD